MSLTPDPSVTPTGGGDDGPENATLIDAIGQGFNNLTNGIGDFSYRLGQLIGQIINWVVGTANNIVTAIGNVITTLVGLFTAALNFILQIIAIMRLLLDLAVGLIDLIFSWLGQAMARAFALLASFYTAAPQPIPGMPLCYTSPTTYDVCAIYYVLDYTLLASGTPGQFIIPLLTVIMNVFIVMWFVRFALKILRKGASVTNVG